MSKKSKETSKEPQKDKSAEAGSLIMTHTGYSALAGLTPIPGVDLVAVSKIHVDMLRQLTELYGLDYNEKAMKGLISAISGTLLARVGASLIKAIPGIGSLVGGASSTVISAAVTYGLGHTFRQHYEKGGTLENFNIEAAQAIFKENFERGKEVVKKMK